MNSTLSPDERAEMVLKELTLDEKIDLVHGEGMPGWRGKVFPKLYLGNGGAGLVLGVERLGIPMIQISDAAYGVRSSAENGRYSTALPSNLGSAASWDPQAACDYGALIGRELRAQGYNMTLGGGVNLTREPRDGRTFETPLVTAPQENPSSIENYLRVLGLLYLFPVLEAAVSSSSWHRHLEQISPMTAGLAVQATSSLASSPISPWAGLGVLAAWAAGALLVGALVLRLRDA